MPKGPATLGDGQMVTGGSVNRVGIGWPESGERWVTAHGWYHVDCFCFISGFDGAGKNVLALSKSSVLASVPGVV